MALVYSDESSNGDGAAFDPTRCDAVKLYMKHYNNALYLTFMLSNGTTVEKHEASKEMVICERKMKYWERQPHFCTEEANRQRIAAKKLWK